MHYVWATKNRLPLIKQEWERALYRCIEQEAQRLKCSVLAIGGMEDHVHTAVRMPSTTNPAKLMQMVKGVSSHFLNKMSRSDADTPDFDWQDNYAVFSLSRSHLPNAIHYVSHQKEHHKNGTTWPEWEETSEDAP